MGNNQWHLSQCVSNCQNNVLRDLLVVSPKVVLKVLGMNSALTSLADLETLVGQILKELHRGLYLLHWVFGETRQNIIHNNRTTMKAYFRSPRVSEQREIDAFANGGLTANQHEVFVTEGSVMIHIVLQGAVQ